MRVQSFAVALFLGIGSSSVAACATQETDFTCEGESVDFCGSLLRSNVATLLDRVTAGEDVSLIMTGGDSRAALTVARLAQSYNGRLEVREICGSSCLEALIPGFDVVEFHDQPLLVAHGNVQMIVGLLRERGYSLPDCYVDYIGSFEEILGSKVDDALWREQVARLGVANVRVDDSISGCPRVHYTSEVDYWIPTGEELERYYGVVGVGDVAASSPELTQQAINRHFDTGITFRLGDQILVSE